MKTLFLVRHAKSSWEIGAATDFDRSLNERGLKDAPKMASRIVAAKHSIDHFISSPALRAKTTAAIFAKAYQVAPEDITLIPSLYEPTVSAFEQVTRGIDDRYSTVAIFSHNPEITTFVNSFKVVQVDDMPTWAVAGIRFDCARWQDFRSAPAELLLFWYPKM